MIASPLLILTLTICTAVCVSADKPLNCSKLENLARHRAGNVNTTRFHARGDRFVDFDWDIVKELNAVKMENMVISPISLKVVLAMLYEGARGQTAREIKEALNLNTTTPTPGHGMGMGMRMNTRERFSDILKSLQTSKGEYEIKIGTHVFIDQSAEPKELFQCKLLHYYNSALEKVDFSNSTAAVKVINSWARNVTEGHIQHLISEAEAHSSTIMLLLNAVYFKGLWQMPFPENQTEPAPFHLSESQAVTVPMMNTTDVFHYYDMHDLDAQLIKLPYMGGKFAMFVLLPNKKTGLNGLAQTLGPNRPLADYVRNMLPTTVNLIMPKFEFDFTVSLRPTLEKLNIKTMFTAAADLDDIAETKNGQGLVVSNVLQKAGISVTERGTVAYASTTVELMDKFGGSEEVVEFRADRPFLFFIEDETVDTIVFVGKVTNPDKAKVTEEKIAPASKPVPNAANTPQSTGPATPKSPAGFTTAPVNDPAPAPPAPLSSDKQSGKPPAGLSDTNNVQNAEDSRTKVIQPIQARFNHFDADLLKELGMKESGNFVVSPASIKSLLALALEGAEGSTLIELYNLLRLPYNITEARQAFTALLSSLQKSGNPMVRIDSVAQVFLANTLQPNASYAKALKDYYQADISPVDLSSPVVATNTINSWVRTRTGGLIEDLIEESMITTETYSILTSAIYFDGKWRQEFQQERTEDKCFHSTPTLTCQMVPTMYKSEELPYRFDRSLDSHILQMPYKEDKFSMVIVLPREMDGIGQLTVDASRLTFPKILENMRQYEVKLSLPRFTMEYSTGLTDTLIKMGLHEVFSEVAQLPYMIQNTRGRIGAVVHKAKIEVSEKGTKAAAASGASVVPLMSGDKKINLDVNHPFYYFIYDRDSQTVLFSGRVSSVEGTRAVGDNSGNQLPSGPGVQPLSHQYVPTDPFNKPQGPSQPPAGQPQGPVPTTTWPNSVLYPRDPVRNTNTGSTRFPGSTTNVRRGSYVNNRQQPYSGYSMNSY